MAKPSIYLDTNIFSALHDGSSLEVLIACKIATREWWDLERSNFAVFTSRFTEVELRKGSYRGQASALSETRRQKYLRYTNMVDEVAVELLDAHIVPLTEPMDALHLATAIVHRMDYLLSWNQKHLSNEIVMEKLNKYTARKNLTQPLIMTPITIPWWTRGDTIRRRI